MNRRIAIVITAALLATGCQADTCDPFDQESFPCTEDEVLGYGEEFGPGRVGCIHIEELAAGGRED